MSTTSNPAEERAEALAQFVVLVRRVLIVLALAVTAGCSAYADENDVLGSGDVSGSGGGPGESVAVQTEALSACGSNLAGFCSTPDSYLVNGSLETRPTSDWICWPTEISATPSGNDPFFFVEQTQTGKWNGSGWGVMTCVPKCCFTSDQGDADVRWLSPTFSITSANNQALTVNMWLGDAMPILSGLMKGRDMGPMLSNERGRVEWTAKTDFTKLRAVAAAGHNEISATGYSFFVGRPSSGHNIKAEPPMGIGNAYSATNGQLTPMIQHSKGICVFTNLAQQGDTMRSRIFRSGGRYWLTTTTTTAVNARCYYFNQNQLN